MKQTIMTTIKPTSTISPERQLQDTVKKNGFIYKLVKRGNHTAIYAQHTKEKNGEAGKIVGYEVFMIKTGGGAIMFGTMVEPYEIFPGNSAFGNTAFAVISMERAEVRFAAIEAGEVEETVEVEEEEEVVVED